MKIIIVGAGLGGLTAAFILAQRGHDVHVLEHHASLNPRGSAINIRACATRILHRWGLEQDLEAISEDTPTALLRNLATGDVVTRNILTEVSTFPEWGTTRHALIELFYRKAVESRACVEFGMTVVDVYDHRSGTDDMEHLAFAVLKNNTVMSADIILVADGVRSRLRSQILSDLSSPGSPGAFDPHIGNTTLYGVAIPGRLLLGNESTRSLSHDVNINCWLGKNKFIVSRFSRRFQVWRSSFIIRSDERDNNSDKMWDENGDINYVRSFFANSSCLQITTALNMSQSCDRWKLAELPNLPRWTSKNGRIVLLGDSAHAMHPNAAQGYSQIVEDIGVLEYLIQELHSSSNSNSSTAAAAAAAEVQDKPNTNTDDQIPQITQLWQTLRKPRAERIKQYARWNTDMFLGAPLAPLNSTDDNDNDGQKTNIKSLAKVTTRMHASFHSSAFVKWALDFDVIDEAQSVLNANPGVVDDTSFGRKSKL